MRLFDGGQAGAHLTDPESRADVEELVERAAGGDRAAFRELVERYHARIHRWALAITSDPDEAEDVTQTVLLKVHRSLDSFAGRSAFGTWLYRVTRNAALDRTRRRRETVPLEEAPAESISRVGEPVDDVEAERLVNLVRRYLGGLSPRQREVFDLADLQGLEAAEIARLLELEPVTVRVHLMRARRAIRSRMLEDHPEWIEEYER